MKKQILSLILAGATAISFAGCSDAVATVDKSKAPDYSNATGEFITYGYHSPIPTNEFYDTNGELWYVAPEKTYATVERYKEYLDCGLNTMFLQANDPYRGEDYATSNLKKRFDTCKEAGIDKVILTDTRLHTTIGTNVLPIIGIADELTDDEIAKYEKLDESGSTKLNKDSHVQLFQRIYGADYAAGTEKTIEDLARVMVPMIKDYIQEPSFFGVMLKDEPTFGFLDAVANTYKALKLAFPMAKAEVEAAGGTVYADDIYVQVNLLPYYGKADFFFDESDPANAGKTRREFYEDYVKRYLEISGTMNLTVDTYPMKQDGIGDDASYYIEPDHFVTIQVLAEATQGKKGMTMGGLAASTELSRDRAYTDIATKAPTESDMYYQLNSYLMFGYDQFAYYTYWAKTSTADVRRYDTMFINRDGTRAPLYYTMTQIHKEMQTFAPILMQYEYKGLKYYRSQGLSYSAPYLSELNQMEESFQKLKSVSIGTDQVGIVTELYDEAKNQYMYAVMNTQAPGNGNFSQIRLDAELEFDSSCSAVMMVFRGETYYLPLKNGKLTVNLSAGHAAYIMPF